MYLQQFLLLLDSQLYVLFTISAMTYFPACYWIYTLTFSFIPNIATLTHFLHRYNQIFWTKYQIYWTKYRYRFFVQKIWYFVFQIYQIVQLIYLNFSHFKWKNHIYWREYHISGQNISYDILSSKSDFLHFKLITCIYKMLQSKYAMQYQFCYNEHYQVGRVFY